MNPPMAKWGKNLLIDKTIFETNPLTETHILVGNGLNEKKVSSGLLEAANIYGLFFYFICIKLDIVIVVW